jgi:hypothetical protein
MNGLESGVTTGKSNQNTFRRFGRGIQSQAMFGFIYFGLRTHNKLKTFTPNGEKSYSLKSVPATKYWRPTLLRYAGYF